MRSVCEDSNIIKVWLRFGSGSVETLGFFFLNWIFIHKIACIARIFEGRSKGVWGCGPQQCHNLIYEISLYFNIGIELLTIF